MSLPSTVIRRFNYVLDTRELSIEFQSGRRYTYLEVPQEVFVAMNAALSQGEYYNENIRDRYRFVRRNATDEPFTPDKEPR